ncbi:MAG: hypothetical protein A3F91_09615 [Flavobacteria bacterium RIFCSPLOWO2_12_FULL_35_11]|nr:MAG: hypothetical protein A3F91_09615 [Flavobacteria bacterium RIFCSPLOWO2_12_FULL_35_11]
MKIFTRVTSIEEISSLENLVLKDGLKLNFAIFFKSKNAQRKSMIEKGDLALYVHGSLINTGDSINCEYQGYEEMGMNEFVLAIKKQTGNDIRYPTCSMKDFRNVSSETGRNILDNCNLSVVLKIKG